MLQESRSRTEPAQCDAGADLYMCGCLHVRVHLRVHVRMHLCIRSLPNVMPV